MILVGLGSNLSSRAGDSHATISAAVDAIEGAGSTLVRCSRQYRTAPVGPADQPAYINAVLALETALLPELLLARLHEIEAAFGRRREGRWRARTLDLDLLDWRGLVLPDLEGWRAAVDDPAPPGGLILPHPRLHLRRFVLAPLAEIAPDWRHPVLRKSAHNLLETVGDQGLRRLG